jgi:hypothetical protein
MTNNVPQFEAYHYRTSSRFGSRVAVTLDAGRVTVSGPRAPLVAYRVWIGIQAVLLALVALALVLAIALHNGWYVLGAVLLLLIHAAAGGVGAGCMWELMNLIAFMDGRKGDSITFTLADVQDVRIGDGWARRGMWLLLLPFVGGINSMAKEVAVSFIAPTDAAGGTGVYALHMRTSAEAQSLAALLRGE